MLHLEGGGNIRTVVLPSFPMMTITSSMMMMMSCFVDPVGAEVANQSNSDMQAMQHSSTLGAWVCRTGWGAGSRVKYRFASSAHFLSPAILFVSAVLAPV